MVKDCLIIGKTNVGKTQFVLNFAEYMGLKKIKIAFHYYDGPKTFKNFTLPQAKKILVGPQPHKTRCLQSISLTFPAGKGAKEIFFTDTAGLIDGIHQERDVRKAMAQTLESIREAHLILHMVDAAQIGKLGLEEALGEFDHQMAHYGAMRSGYAVLANKIDLPEGRGGVKTLESETFSTSILPISALDKKGFKEVKAFVWRNL